MKTALVISSDPAFSAAARAATEGSAWCTAAFTSMEGARSALRTGLADAAILDADLDSVTALRAIDGIRAESASIPILIVAGRRVREWEEDALLHGADRILDKPLRSDLLCATLARLAFAPAPLPAPPAPPSAPARRLDSAPTTFRDASALLAADADPQLLAENFLGIVRDRTGVNRATLFLEANAGQDALVPVVGTGVASGLSPLLEWKWTSGLPLEIRRTGRVVRAEETTEDAARDLRVVGASLALPIQSGSRPLGVLCLDDPLAGGTLGPDQLTAVFRLGESLGAALERALRRQLESRRATTMSAVPARIGCGCVLFSADGSVVHADPLSVSLLGGKVPEALRLFPAAISSAVTETLRGSVSAQPPVFQSTLGIPVRARVFPWTDESDRPGCLLALEDATIGEREATAAAESARDDLVRLMAEHLAHEIGNSLAPLSTHQQLLAQRIDDPAFRDSLSQTMADTVRRIGRFSRQVMYLSRKEAGRTESVSVTDLVYEAFRDAKDVFAGGSAGLDFTPGTDSLYAQADRKALRHALAELFLNALQASPDDPQIHVEVSLSEDAGTVDIVIRDHGPGFPGEVLRRADEPFYSTRNVGLGLGLPVARHILQLLGGSLALPSRPAEGVVRLRLPGAIPTRNITLLTGLN